MGCVAFAVAVLAAFSALGNPHPRNLFIVALSLTVGTFLDLTRPQRRPTARRTR